MSDYQIGTPLNEILGGQVSHVSTSEPVVDNRVLGMCGMDVSTTSAAPDRVGNDIAALVAKPKPLGLG